MCTVTLYLFIEERTGPNCYDAFSLVATQGDGIVARVVSAGLLVSKFTDRSKYISPFSGTFHVDQGLGSKLQSPHWGFRRPTLRVKWTAQAPQYLCLYNTHSA